MSEGELHNKKYFPNKMGRNFLAALQDTLVQEGYMNLLRWADLAHYEGSLPEDNWTKAFDFAAIAKLNQGLFTLFGPRGGQRLARMAGRRFFRLGFREIGYLAGITDLASRSLPLQVKLREGLIAMARTFNQTSDQSTELVEQELYFSYVVNACPICWQQSSQEPICFITVGFLQEALAWLGDGKDFRVRQIRCTAMNDDNCSFRIDREPIK